MARIRTVKPEFFEDETLAKLSAHSRLLFIGCFLLADKNGVLENRPAWIQSKVFPYETGEASDVSRMLPGLVLGRYLTEYTVNGRAYLAVRNFSKHQRITGKEAKSNGLHPLPPEEPVAGKHPGSTREAPGATPDAQEQGTGNREQGTGNREQCADAETPFDDSDAVSEPTDSDRWRMEATLPWSRALISEGGKIGPKNWTAWKRLADKHGLPSLVAACQGSDPEGRWPDKIEKSITQSRGQASISAAVAHKVTKL